MLNRRLKLLNISTGDTIVEVLIAVSIVGFVLVGAIGDINRNVQIMEDGQEHAQALKLVDNQIEDLRAVGGDPPAGCYYYNNVTNNITPIATPSSAFCVVEANGDLAPTGTEPAYGLSISVLNTDGPNSSPTYLIKATWDSILGNTDQVSLVYRNN
jgi:type II secretory pathway pseudopilin PulG